MNMYFYIASATAVLSLIGIILLIVYLARTNPRTQEGYEDYNSGGYEPQTSGDDSGYTQWLDDDGLTKEISASAITFTDIETGQRIEKEVYGILSIGRNSENDLVVPDQRTSGKHCRIIADNGRLYIEDLSSRNGTRVNGETITGCTELKNGDSIQLGKVVYKVSI